MFAHYFANLGFRELINEVVNVHVAATDTNHNLVPFLNLNMDAPRPKLIHAFRLTQEQYPQLILLRIIIQKAFHGLVYSVLLMTNINIASPLLLVQVFIHLLVLLPVFDLHLQLL